MKIALITALGLLLGVAVAQQKSGGTPPPAARADRQQDKQEITGGELFEIHCRRCHQYPISIPPKAAATVVSHMRVRALLPADQAQQILKFLAP